MIYAVICLAVVCCLLLVAWVTQTRELRADRCEAERAWLQERRELLNRIQRPEILPVQAAEPFELPEAIPDEWSKVGTVNIDPDYGLSDE